MYKRQCLEGAIIALACIIFSAYAASPPAVGDTELSAVPIVWNYVGELVFNLLVDVYTRQSVDRADWNSLFRIIRMVRRLVGE